MHKTIVKVLLDPKLSAKAKTLINGGCVTAEPTMKSKLDHFIRT